MSYKPGQFMYQAAKDVRKTGRLSRRSFMRAAAETLGLVGVVGGAVLMPEPARAMERNPNGYPVPDLSGLRPYQMLHYDVNAKIPGKETFVERYRTPDGAKVARLSVGGKAFCYSIRERGHSKGYAILDSTGNGVFNTKYYDGEEFDVPDWLVKVVLAKR